MFTMLTPRQLQDFERDGYLLVRNLFDAAEMRDIIAWTDDIAAWPEVPGQYMMYFEQSRREPGRRILNRIEDIEPYHAGFSDLFLGEKLQGVAAELLGEPAVLYKDKINFKMPGGDGFRAHQDVQAGWDTYAGLHITALVSIDASTPANGCLEMAAGMHRAGLLGDKWKPLDENTLEYTAIPTQPGDAVFFDSYAPHRSGPNMTDSPRRVLYVTYNRLSEGDQRRRYYRDKRRNYPPDCEREPGREYVFRV